MPNQIEQSSVSVFRRERGLDDLSVLLTWTALTSEQAGGVLTNYIISIYNQPISVYVLVMIKLVVERLLCLVEGDYCQSK